MVTWIVLSCTKIGEKVASITYKRQWWVLLVQTRLGVKLFTLRLTLLSVPHWLRDSVICKVNPISGASWSSLWLSCWSTTTGSLFTVGTSTFSTPLELSAALGTEPAAGFLLRSFKISLWARAHNGPWWSDWNSLAWSDWPWLRPAWLRCLRALIERDLLWWWPFSSSTSGNLPGSKLKVDSSR